MKISKTIIALITLVATTSSAVGRTLSDSVRISKFRAERNGSYLSVDMTIGLSELDVESNRAVLLTPHLVNGAEILKLPSVAIYGRKRYYHYKRNAAETMISGTDETTLRAKDIPSEIAYHELVPYAEWLDGATVVLDRTDYGCCRQVLAQEQSKIGSYREEFFPQLVYIRPSGEVEKRRSLEGRAYIDFPVDQTVIYPDYRRNAIELDRIRATIDTVRNDPDATIDSVWLKGWASPESPYSHNTDLAIGRTQALKQYIQRMYNFTGVAMLTDYEPENWIGLRRFVENSNLEHRSEILAMIDLDMDPDAKEAKIKRTYPEEYRFMLQTFYPALRRTDYRVSYHIRQFTDPGEILKIMREQPQKLSQNEFYLAASSLEPGTPEFTEVFETAVRMFPDDEIANLNAANAAMRRGDNNGAERYLNKAGNSPEAIYARGALAIRRKDYETARRFLSEARDAGLEQAATTLDELTKR